MDREPAATVLFLTNRTPYPPDKGDRIRTFNVLQFLVRVQTFIWPRLPMSRSARSKMERCDAYLAALGADVEGRCMEALYLFLATGKTAETCSMDENIRAVHAARDFFRSQSSVNDPELEAGIRRQQDSLRWRCTHLAEQNWRRPWRALTWLRRAARVDPNKAGLAGLVRRRLAQVAGRPGTGGAVAAK